jgi:hypothetical protein
MSLQSAQDALNLVGKTIRPAHGTERWAFANGKPRAGKVVDVRILDLNHTNVLIDFGYEHAYLSPFECEIVTP